ncbi:MAG: nuclear transport factor 2 family protein [Flavobacteriia bacterium]|nr:nuclear transport factor 2 family protein [Flavobacteriia bacterium]
MRVVIFFFIALNAHYFSAQQDVKKLNELIQNWHKAASDAKFDSYFNCLTDDFIFLGTAPGERWTKKEFQDFSKPFFDRGKAWDFKASNRIWNFSKDGKTAWFDEDLATWMQGCRGSGVCIKIKGLWSISYYNLTVLIENEKIKEFIELRKN